MTSVWGTGGEVFTHILWKLSHLGPMIQGCLDLHLPPFQTLTAFPSSQETQCLPPALLWMPFCLPSAENQLLLIHQNPLFTPPLLGTK
jgi:hypothetical protein